MKTDIDILDATQRASSPGMSRWLLRVAVAALWVGATQAQSIAGAAADSATEMHFRDFFHMPVGAKGLDPSAALLRAAGSRVRLVGYMVQQEQAPPGRFLLVPRPVQMNEHADGDADDLPPSTVLVYLDPAQRDWIVPHVRGLVAVTGTLSVGRNEESDGRVSWVRLQLDPDAARATGPSE